MSAAQARREARLEAAIARIAEAAERLRTAEERGRAHAAAIPGACPSDTDVFLASYLAAVAKSEAAEIKATLDDIRPKRRA